MQTIGALNLYILLGIQAIDSANPVIFSSFRLSPLSEAIGRHTLC